MDGSSDDSFEKKRKAKYDVKEKLSDEELSDYVSQDSEEEAERVRK